VGIRTERSQSDASPPQEVEIPAAPHRRRLRTAPLQLVLMILSERCSSALSHQKNRGAIELTIGSAARLCPPPAKLSAWRFRSPAGISSEPSAQEDALSSPADAARGKNAALRTRRNCYLATPPRSAPRLLPHALSASRKQSQSAAATDAHIQNFLECVRTRKQPNGTIEKGFQAALVIQMANLSLETGRRIRWNSQTLKVEA